MRHVLSLRRKSVHIVSHGISRTRFPDYQLERSNVAPLSNETVIEAEPMICVSVWISVRCQCRCVVQTRRLSSTLDRERLWIRRFSSKTIVRFTDNNTHDRIYRAYRSVLRNGCVRPVIQNTRETRRSVSMFFERKRTPSRTPCEDIISFDVCCSQLLAGRRVCKVSSRFELTSIETRGCFRCFF